MALRSVLNACLCQCSIGWSNSVVTRVVSLNDGCWFACFVQLDNLIERMSLTLTLVVSILPSVPCLVRRLVWINYRQDRASVHCSHSANLNCILWCSGCLFMSLCLGAVSFGSSPLSQSFSFCNIFSLRFLNMPLTVQVCIYCFHSRNTPWFGY